ncbi:TPA: hypothetical protein DEP21_03535 [Patescibacteria group bacterium]|nr:hypothetical protein [Candidatus Gracilibacteria bacterium]
MEDTKALFADFLRKLNRERKKIISLLGAILLILFTAPICTIYWLQLPLFIVYSIEICFLIVALFIATRSSCFHTKQRIQILKKQINNSIIELYFFGVFWEETKNKPLENTLNLIYRDNNTTFIQRCLSTKQHPSLMMEKMRKDIDDMELQLDFYSKIPDITIVSYILHHIVHFKKRKNPLV